MCVEVHLALRVHWKQSVAKHRLRFKTRISRTQLQQLRCDGLSDTGASTRDNCNLVFEQTRFEHTGRRHIREPRSVKYTGPRQIQSGRVL